MKVMVTGAAGYVGSVLCNTLVDRGHAVVGLDTFRYGNCAAVLPLLRSGLFAFHRVDVRDVGSVSRLAADCDVIFPLAAVVGAPACDRSPAEAQAVNADSVSSLVKTLSRSQRVCYPMTNSGYGVGGERECTEESPLRPLSLYGRSKAEAEQAVLDRGNSVSVRLATVFGLSPRMRFDLLVNEFTASLVHRGHLAVYEPGFRRNFVHVSDVCRAFRYLAFGARTGVFNCGLPDANLSKIDLAKRVCRAVGLPETAVEVGDGADPDKRDYVVSSDRLLGAGFAFATGLDEGVAEVAAFCRHVTPGEIASMRN